jgi:acyl-CoA hydrolase
MTNLSPHELISRYKGQIETAECAVLAVKAGDRVFVGTACATPRTLVAALETTSRPPPDVELIHFITTAAIPHDQGGRATTKYRHRAFFVGSDVRSAVKLGMADYVPIQISRVPELIERGSISIDVAMIQISPPDEFGYASFGVSVDIIPAAVAAAKWVIAEVNPAMPRTQGDTAIHMRDIDKIVPVTVPVTDMSTFQSLRKSFNRSLATSQASLTTALPFRLDSDESPMRRLDFFRTAGILAFTQMLLLIPFFPCCKPVSSQE